MSKIKQIYQQLLNEHGYQGWWPIMDLIGNAKKGYHPQDYSYPQTDMQRFEICIGAILTQNTSWVNVEKALMSLKKLEVLNPKAIKEINIEELKSRIKNTGYYNQKSIKLKKFTDFYLSLGGRTPTREELLNVWGIGRETADSMLLYAFKVPVFVVDAYTRMVFSERGIIDKNADYDEIKSLFERNLKPELNVYQEYHALIVEHAKRHSQKLYTPKKIKSL